MSLIGGNIFDNILIVDLQSGNREICFCVRREMIPYINVGSARAQRHRAPRCNIKAEKCR